MNHLCYPSLDWLDFTQLNPHQLPPCWRDCFMDSGSTTRWVQHTFSCEMAVHIFHQGCQAYAPVHDHLYASFMQQHPLLWGREVLLSIKKHPFMLAFSVFPQAVIDQKASSILRCGARSLGYVLFSDPQAHRQNMQFSCLPSSHSLYQRTMSYLKESGMHHLPDLWARRSLLPWKGKAIFLLEIFIPGRFSHAKNAL